MRFQVQDQIVKVLSNKWVAAVLITIAVASAARAESTSSVFKATIDMSKCGKVKSNYLDYACASSGMSGKIDVQIAVLVPAQPLTMIPQLALNTSGDLDDALAHPLIQTCSTNYTFPVTYIVTLKKDGVVIVQNEKHSSETIAVIGESFPEDSKEKTVKSCVMTPLNAKTAQLKFNVSELLYPESALVAGEESVVKFSTEGIEFEANLSAPSEQNGSVQILSFKPIEKEKSLTWNLTSGNSSSEKTSKGTAPLL